MPKPEMSRQDAKSAKKTPEDQAGFLIFLGDLGVLAVQGICF
jgi:hypothetical protein